MIYYFKVGFIAAYVFVSGKGCTADFIREGKPMLLGLAKTMTARKLPYQRDVWAGFCAVADSAAILHNNHYN